MLFILHCFGVEKSDAFGEVVLVCSGKNVLHAPLPLSKSLYLNNNAIKYKQL